MTGCHAISGAEANDSDEHPNNKEATNESLPPSGYIVAGKMRLGSMISVPAPNSAHLRRDAKNQKMPPFRSESINSSTSSRSFLPACNNGGETDYISERESISPHRLPHDEVILQT
jgi:hypothetical protein